jgi:hypothetical protein
MSDPMNAIEPITNKEDLAGVFVFDFNHAILVMSDPMNAIEPITNKEDYF